MTANCVTEIKNIAQNNCFRDNNENPSRLKNEETELRSGGLLLYLCMCVREYAYVFGRFHHRKQAPHPAVECDPLAPDQMLLRAEYHEASVLCTTHCSALHRPSLCTHEEGGVRRYGQRRRAPGGGGKVKFKRRSEGNGGVTVKSYL